MSLLEGDGNFKWGIVKAVNGSQRNESFIYKGVEYFLFDCVYVIHSCSMETIIGKIVKMWEDPTTEKKVKVIYFFRPKDIINFLNYEPRWNELFLACGEGEGVCDTFEVGKILGKCNVFYKSDDKRNPPASDVVKEADYYFSSTFNVGTKKVSKVLPEAIEEVAIAKLIGSIRRKRVRFDESCFPERNNGKKTGIGDSGSGTPIEDMPTSGRGRIKGGGANVSSKEYKRSAHSDRGTSISTRELSYGNKRHRSRDAAFGAPQSTRENEYMPMSGRRRIKEVGANVSSMEYKRSAHSDRGTSISTKELSSGNKSHRSRDAAFGVPQSTRECVKVVSNLLEMGANVPAPISVQTEYKINARDGSGTSITNRDNSRGTKSLLRGGEKARDKVIQVTNKPAPDVTKWFNFNQQPWEDRLQSAHQEGKLVFLTNLNPSYTSCDVEDLIYAAFQARADARIIPRVAHSSRH